MGRSTEAQSGLQKPKGAHLQCQQQEERFNAVETSIHKVPHKEVVGLRDITPHLGKGEGMSGLSTQGLLLSPFHSWTFKLPSLGRGLPFPTPSPVSPTLTLNSSLRS